MKRFFPAFVLAALVLTSGAGRLQAAAPELFFGSLEALTPAAAKAKADAWLQETAKADPATLAKAAEIWKQDRPVMDLLADVFALGNPAAAKLLTEARDESVPAPVKVPELFKDAATPLFFRANLGLAYARALSQRRVFEEGLAVLKLFQPEQVADPAAFLFHRAVSEHALLHKDEALRTITRLLGDTTGSPERFKTLGTLMMVDIFTWKDKDLGAVARKMENIERRLDLARGGPETQKQQREVIFRLDELIKELENKAKGQGSGSGSGPPMPGQGPGPGSGNNPNGPMQEPTIVKEGGPGTVDQARLRKMVENWGSLPPAAQTRALQELTQGMSASHREAIENYFRNLAQASK